MFTKIISLILFIPVIFSLNINDLFKIQIDIEKLIINSSNIKSDCIIENGGCCRLNNIGKGEIYGSIIRLAFHDVGYYNKDTNTGGGDGCIDFNDFNNRGLENIYGTLYKLKNSSNINISFADYIQYAALTSIWCSLNTIPIGIFENINNFPFLYGRIDKQTCPYTKENGHLPDPEGGLDELKGMSDRYGMSLLQIFSLLGAHSIGSVKKINSGYAVPADGINAKWVVVNSILNGQEYYFDMIKFPWTRQVNSNKNRHSWFGTNLTSKGNIMLNSDVAMYWDIIDNKCNIQGSTTGTKGGCTINEKFIIKKITSIGLEVGNTARLLEIYANGIKTKPSSYFKKESTIGQDTWFPEFISSFRILSELGYTNLKIPENYIYPSFAPPPKRDPNFFKSKIPSCTNNNICGKGWYCNNDCKGSKSTCKRPPPGCYVYCKYLPPVKGCSANNFCTACLTEWAS
jgi:hypothetical protein